MLSGLPFVQILLNSLCMCLPFLLNAVSPHSIFLALSYLWSVNFFPVTFVLSIFHLNPVVIHKQLQYCLHVYRIYWMTIFQVFNSWMVISNRNVKSLNQIALFPSLCRIISIIYFCLRPTNCIMFLSIRLAMPYF